MFPIMGAGAGMFPNPMMFPAMQGMDPSMFAEMQGIMPGMAMPLMMPGAAQGGDMGAGGKGGADPSAVFYKTRLCNRWKEGTCPYGDACRYAHGEAQLRTLPPQVVMQLQGSGAMGGGGGARSQTHGKIMTPQPAMGAGGGGGSNQDRSAWHKTRVCERFMQTGECNYGNKCTFAHGEHELRAPPNAGGARGGQGMAAMHNVDMQKPGSGVMPVTRNPADGTATNSLKRPLEAMAPQGFNGSSGDGYNGSADGYGQPGDAKRQRGSGAGPIVPPAQERLPDASSPPLHVLKEKFEHLKQEVARFALETGHSVAMFTVGGILSDLPDSGADDFSQDAYLKAVSAPGAAPNLKLAVLKHGTGGICRQLVVRPEIVKFVCARGTKALAELVQQDRLAFDGE